MLGPTCYAHRRHAMRYKRHPWLLLQSLLPAMTSAAMLFAGVFACLLSSFIAAFPLTPRTNILNSIVSPPQNSVIKPGDIFAFQYSLDNWCEAGYTPLSLWLLADQPTSASLNSSEEYSEYIYYFGSWLINNFGASSD